MAMNDDDERPFILKSFKSELSKTAQDSIKKLVEDSQAIVLDIEGTITSFDFVKEELIPYAAFHMEDYVMNNWKDPEVKKAFAELQKQAAIDETLNMEGFVPIMDSPPDLEDSDELQKFLKSIIANIEWQMENDRKTTGLKRLQGLIWKDGYENDRFTGHIYGDVLGAILLWVCTGKKLYIYSSGSRDAQINLLGYSKFGDLTQYFSEYFDTTIGSKLDPNSYKEICNYAGKNPQDTVFFTDRPAEINAAKESGLKTILVVRDPDHPLILEERHLVGIEDGQITSFRDLFDHKF